MQLLTKTLFFMYDPHRLRRNDRRFFTHKGQIIQAKNMSAPFTIERNKVEAYKEYILKNHLIETPSSPLSFSILSTSVIDSGNNPNILISQFEYASETSSQTVPSGSKILIQIQELNDSYDISLFFTNQTSISYLAGKWYGLLNVTNQYNYTINLNSSNGPVLSIPFTNDPSKPATFYLPKSVYNIRLPAASE